MTVKLLTEHHLKFPNLKGGYTACLSLHLSNHMWRLILLADLVLRILDTICLIFIPDSQEVSVFLLFDQLLL